MVDDQGKPLARRLVIWKDDASKTEGNLSYGAAESSGGTDMEGRTVKSVDRWENNRIDMGKKSGLKTNRNKPENGVLTQGKVVQKA